MLPRWPSLRFGSSSLEARYTADRALHWARLDRIVAVPWLLLWLALIRRVYKTVSYAVLLKSFCCLLVTMSPSYLQVLLGTWRYTKHRLLIVTMAKLAYILHPGGGLYRDGLMSVPNTALGAASLFVRMAVGSRTLFWLVLVFGYPLPPGLLLWINAAQLGLLMWIKPSTAWCAAMQTPASEPLFRGIANALPLVSLMPLSRPQLVEGADVCNPLVAWIQIGLGYLLPLLMAICSDISSRRRFIAAHSGTLPPGDAARWLPSKSHSAYCAWTIAALAYPHLLTALWYLLTWRQLEFPSAAGLELAASRAEGAAAAAGMMS